MQQAAPPTSNSASSIRHRFVQTRALSERLCAPLQVEDYCLQACPQVSPPKWHLAHTSWFFETFIIKHHTQDFSPYQSEFEVLFNSYYNGVSEQFPRPKRGMLSRPGLDEVMRYREHVTGLICDLLEQQPENADVISLVELGINHEQQHQELMLSDIKRSFFENPLFPAYLTRPSAILSLTGSTPPLAFIDFEEGLFEVGHHHDTFCFDNEQPRHRVHLDSFKLADRLVTNAEFATFVEDGGYQKPELWLSDGWAMVCEQHVNAPLYWQQQDNQWYEFTLHGLMPLIHNLPVSHISYYEADAFARWAGKRLPTEMEWEVACTQQRVHSGKLLDGTLDSGLYLPEATSKASFPLAQMQGDCWQWTASAYSPYPGFSACKGAVGEYNGKFMCNQMVLRGASFATANSHVRPTYRNFYYPHDRWQFSGIRLADST